MTTNDFKGDLSKVAVIIVTYNSSQYLKDCFSSLNPFVKRGLRVLVVDNNSNDQTVAEIKEKYQFVELIESKENLGFAAGNNLGLKMASKYSGVEYFFLLNPDTIVDEKCFDFLISQSNQHTILQPLLLLWDGVPTETVNSWGNPLHFLGVSYAGGMSQSAKGISSGEIALASGAALWLPKTIYQAIGGFDEDYFMYAEDQELCWRARRFGYVINLVKEARVWHKYTFSRNPKKFYLIERNRWYFLLTSYQLKTLVLLAPLLLLGELAILFISIPKGFFREKTHAIWSVWRAIPRIYQKRLKYNAKIVKEDHDLIQFWSSALDFSEMRLPLQSLLNILLGLYWNVVKIII